MMNKAYFAGGCFWGMEELFRHLNGVIDTEVGYCGGTHPNPTYEVHDGHAETLEITYDDAKTSYSKLLQFFFSIHNPTTPNRQGNDIGDSYRSAIFYQNIDEKNIAEQLIAQMNQSGKWGAKIVTEVAALKQFYAAEDYHQDYLQRHPNGYSCHFVRKDWII
jgi:peptide-methionine (S)-S-oxide reductase